MRNLLGFPESKDDGLGKPHCGNGVWGMGSCMAWSLGNKAWTNLMVGRVTWVQLSVANKQVVEETRWVL